MKGIFHLVVKGIKLGDKELVMIEQRNALNQKTGFYEIRLNRGDGHGMRYYGMQHDMESASMLYDDAYHSFVVMQAVV
jgi:hypothetical protein